MTTPERSQKHPLTFEGVGVWEKETRMRGHKNECARCDFLVGVWPTLFVEPAIQFFEFLNTKAVTGTTTDLAPVSSSKSPLTFLTIRLSPFSPPMLASL